MTKPLDDKNRLTVEALRYYVPIFQDADLYYETFAATATEEQKPLVDAALKLREFAVDAIMDLAKPLIIRELQRILSTSHVKKDDESIFDLLYYAARGGAVRGIRHFDVELLDQSATNYLFMWLTTYAQKELNAIEAAPFGIPPSRFRVYKKISAVRKKLTEAQGHYATNEEVLEAFLGGKADIKTMNGRKSNAGKASAANQKMTLKYVEEQEYFERNLISQNLVDPLDQQMTRSIYGTVMQSSFGESIFGVFLEAHSFTPEAKVALKSELQAEMTAEEHELLDSLDSLVLKRLSFRWKLLLRDQNGIFADFLEEAKYDDYQELDIARVLKSMKSQSKLIKRSQWEILLTPEETKIKTSKGREKN